jgi:hypothetical protein
MEDRSATNPAQDFLDEEFPVAHRHLIPSALRRAYSTASRVVEAEPSLQTLAWISHTPRVTARRYPVFESIINLLQEVGPRSEGDSLFRYCARARSN